MTTEKSWRLFCSHGAVLFYIARHPNCTIDDISCALVVTPRTAWRLVRDLKGSGLVAAHADGRRHRYSIEEESSLPDPALSHLNLRDLMNALA